MYYAFIIPFIAAILAFIILIIGVPICYQFNFCYNWLVGPPMSGWWYLVICVLLLHLYRWLDDLP